MSNKFFIGILVAIAVIFGGVLLNDRKSNQNSNDSGNNSQSATKHTKGSDKTGVVLIEYGDFECKFCWAKEPLVKEVVEKYKDQITFQFRHFPLNQIHPNAFAAHRIAEAAGKQGKFWEMHDMLFEQAYQLGGNDAIPTEWVATKTPMTFFEEYAKQLGLDVEKLKTDAASQEINNAINADIKEGQKLGITGTPAFVLDGVKIETPATLEEFSKLIDEAIKKKSTS